MTDFDVRELREIRAHHPHLVAEAAARRTRHPAFRGREKLTILAADHTARGVLSVRGVEGAMADRADLLRRLVVALSRPGVDGVVATADILDDLLLLGVLEGKLVFGSMNRGGLHRSSFEIDDRFTSYDAASLAAMGFDGGKMLCRIDFADTATASALEACGKAVTDLAGRRLVAMVEPFICTQTEGGLRTDLSPRSVTKSVVVAAALGSASAYTWLKLPVVEDMEEVVSATTMPVFLLGGDPDEAPGATYARWARALAVPGVRGLVVGRALLYPPDADVAGAVDAAVSVVSASCGRPPAA